MSEQEIFDTITFDDHTELQTYFLQNLPIENKTTFLKCDKNFTNTLNKFLMSNGYREVRNPYTVNVSEGTKLQIKESLRNLLETHPEYLDRIKQHFSKDYELINSVKFYD